MKAWIFLLLVTALPSSAMGDILFQTLEKWHGGKEASWGRFLDAGTGVGSLKWYASSFFSSSLRYIHMRSFIFSFHFDILFTYVHFFSSSSLRYRAQQQITTTSITAITADVQMQHQVISEPSVNVNLRPVDQILVGNWMDEHFW
jgi:hypothetical protein